MAKKSQIARDKRRAKLIEQYAERRNQLKAIINNAESTDEERQAAYRKLRRIPRNSSPTRKKNRCGITGRPRGYIRKFGMSRISFREYALKGEIPGVTKASW